MYIPLLDFMVKCAVHWHKYTEIVWNCLVYINRLEATLVIKVVYFMANKPSVVTKAFPSRLNWSRNRWKIPILEEFVLNECFHHHLEHGGIWFWIKKWNSVAVFLVDLQLTLWRLKLLAYVKAVMTRKKIELALLRTSKDGNQMLLCVGELRIKTYQDCHGIWK